MRTVKASAAFAFAALFVVTLAIGVSGPVEGDALFHLAIAGDYSKGLGYRTQIAEGALAHFHADREILFHGLLAALKTLGFEDATLLVAVPALATGSLALVLWTLTGSWWAVAIGVAGSNTALFRMTMCRPQGPAVVLVVLGLGLLLRRRYKSAALVNLLYTWSYSVPVLIAGAALFEAIERRRIRGLLWILGASAAALVAHPHFPDNLAVLWYQGPVVIAQAFFGAGGEVSVASELRSWSLARFAIDCWLPLAVMVAGFARKRSRLPLWFIAFEVALLALSLRATRLVEYQVPVVALGASGTIAYLLAPAGPRLCWLIVALFILARPAVGWWSVHETSIEAAARGQAAAGAAVFLRDAARGARVLNLRWDDYPALRYLGRTFAIAEGHDPAFLGAYDPERAALFERLEAGEVALDEYCETIGYEWIVAPRDSPLEHWPRAATAEKAYQDARAVVLRIACPGRGSDRD